MLRIQLILLVLVLCVSGAAAQPAPDAPRPTTPTDAPEPRPGDAPPAASPYAQPAPSAQPAPYAQPTTVAEPTAVADPYYPPTAPSEESAAPSASTAGPFARGKLGLSVLIGFGSTFSSDYLILGAGVGYFLLDGLELELAGEVWTFGDPTISKLTPGLRYVLHMVPVVKPYIGGFYRYTMIEDPFENVSSIGARVGVFLVKSQQFMLGLGGVAEYYIDSGYDTVWYPELTLSVSL